MTDPACSSLCRGCVRHTSGLPHTLPAAIGVSAQSKFMLFFSFLHAGNLHATYVIEVSRRSGPWTTTWNCTREKSLSSAPGLRVTTPSSQRPPWRTTTGRTQVCHGPPNSETGHGSPRGFRSVCGKQYLTCLFCRGCANCIYFKLVMIVAYENIFHFICNVGHFSMGYVCVHVFKQYRFKFDSSFPEFVF